MAIVPAKGKLVKIIKPSSEYRGKTGKLVEETTEGAWWVSMDKGHVLEVMAPSEFEVLPGRKKQDHEGASNPPFAVWE